MDSNIIGFLPNWAIYTIVLVAVLAGLLTFFHYIIRFAVVMVCVVILIGIANQSGVLEWIKKFANEFSNKDLAVVKITPVAPKAPLNSFVTPKGVAAAPNTQAPTTNGFSLEGLELASAPQAPVTAPKQPKAPVPPKKEVKEVVEYKQICFDDCGGEAPVVEAPKPVVKPVPVKPAPQAPVVDIASEEAPPTPLLDKLMGNTPKATDPKVTCKAGEETTMKGTPFATTETPKESLCINNCVASVVKKPKGFQPIIWGLNLTRNFGSPYKGAKIITLENGTSVIEGKFVTTGEKCG